MSAVWEAWKPSMIDSYIADRLNGTRVLVVEDDHVVALEMSNLLRSHGALVLGPVSSVAEASQWLANSLHQAALDNWPHLAILDVRLGEEMVFPLADALSLLGVPFLFASGFPRYNLPRAYKNVPYHEKPLETRAVLQTLASLVKAT